MKNGFACVVGNVVLFVFGVTGGLLGAAWMSTVAEETGTVDEPAGYFDQKVDGITCADRWDQDLARADRSSVTVTECVLESGESIALAAKNPTALGHSADWTVTFGLADGTTKELPFVFLPDATDESMGAAPACRFDWVLNRTVNDNVELPLRAVVDCEATSLAYHGTGITSSFFATITGDAVAQLYTCENDEYLFYDPTGADRSSYLVNLPKATCVSDYSAMAAE